MLFTVNNKKQLIKVGLPIALQSTLLSSMGLINCLMISPLGDVALASVGVGARWLTFISMLLFSFASCGQVLMSHSKGANDRDGFVRLSHMSSTHVVTLGFLIGLIFFIFPGFITSFIADSENISNYVEDYIRLTGLIIFLTGICVSIDAIMRSVKKTKESLYACIIEIILNIVLNYILIFGIGNFQGYGILGAGLASVTARLVRVLVLLYVVNKSEQIFFFTPNTIRHAIQTSLIQKYYSYAWPMIISSLAWSSGVFCMHAIIGHMGEQELAIMSILAPFELVALCFVSGVCVGASILIGQALGAKEFDKAYKMAKDAMLLSLIVGSVCSLVFAAAAFVFVSNQAYLSVMTTSTILMMLPFLSISIIARTITSTFLHGILKTGGDTKFCMYVDVICQWGIAIPIVFVAGIIFKLSLPVIYLLIQVEEILKIIPCYVRIRQKKWIKTLA